MCAGEYSAAVGSHITTTLNITIADKNGAPSEIQHANKKYYQAPTYRM